MQRLPRNLRKCRAGRKRITIGFAKTRNNTGKAFRKRTGRHKRKASNPKAGNGSHGLSTPLAYRLGSRATGAIRIPVPHLLSTRKLTRGRMIFSIRTRISGRKTTSKTPKSCCGTRRANQRIMTLQAFSSSHNKPTIPHPHSPRNRATRRPHPRPGKILARLRSL